MKSALLTGLLTVVVATGSGCAVHYYDKTTGTEHLWGFGHLRMRVTEPSEGVRTVVKGYQEFGLGIGLGCEEYYLSAGYNNRRQLIVLNENTAVRMEWPKNDFFGVRVGTNVPPPLPDQDQPNSPNHKETEHETDH